jgi:hypothetical protein
MCETQPNIMKIEQDNQLVVGHSIQVEFLSSDLSSVSYDQLSRTRKCQKSLVLISTDRISTAVLF